MASLKRGSDEDPDEPSAKAPRRDDDDSGGRRGRIRKKSAKVLEMEEFEEIEKKQYFKKSDPKGKQIQSTPPAPSSAPPAKKGKSKGSGEEQASPDPVVVKKEAPAAAPIIPEVASKPEGANPIKASTNPVKASTNPVKAATNPVKASTNPVKASTNPVKASTNPVKASTNPVKASTNPVKASTKQAIGAKLKEGQGSVIKLLLSSPTIPTTPSVSTSVITKTSPPVTVSSSSSSISTVLPAVPALTPKRVSVKVKSEPAVKSEPVPVVPQEDLSLSASVKSELMDPQAGNVMLSSTVSQEPVTPAIIKSEPAAASSDNLNSLKLKLLMSPKDIETVVPTSYPIQNLFVENPDPITTTVKTTPKTSKAAKDTPTTSKKKPAAPRKKKAEKGGEKSGKQAAGNKSAAEQMPNLAALVYPKAQKGVKEEGVLSLSDGGLDASMSDTSLDMSSIVESALDMEEEAGGLVIAEGAAAPPAKAKKKKASGGGGTKKKAKAKAQPAAEVTPSFDSDEGAHPEGGDIPILTAKVQRSFGVAGGKKKSSKKSQEQQETSGDKKKRPSRRAPTAYMLYCNSQRPKVVFESPGIDFAQISRTLGVMWQCLSKKEKMMWRRKSKKMAGKGSTLISTGKGSKKVSFGAGAAVLAATPAHPPAARASAGSKASKASASAALTGEDGSLSPVKGFGVEPIDIAAHLKLLGESLSIIGNRLQEHKGLIAVQGSLSVLLDSMLCACGPLLALTHQVPGLDGCSECTHARTLDRVAYIMPGL